MKKIIVLFALLLGSIISIAQPVTQRGTTSVTVQDARLFAQYNFRPPVFPDTTSANTQIGLDSCGALIFSRDINAYYYRACSPKRWVRVASGGATADSAYLSYRPLTDSTFLLCRVGGTRCDTIKINGKGVTQAWLLGGNLNPVSNNLGTISTSDVVIITNDVARMKIAGNGINRSSAARNRYLMIDTLTRYLFYGDESDTTAWKLAGNSNAIAGSSFVGTTNNVPLEFRVKNIKSGIIDSNYRNTALGYASQRFSQATPGTDSALNNVSMGFRALGANIYGDDNTAIGYAANALGTNLKGNTAIGYGAGAQNRTSSFDVAVGWGALPRNYYGYANTAVGADIANIAAPGVGDTMTYNTMLGYGSAYYKYTGRNNVFVGDSTGANNTTGSRNVFIGSKAGKNETGSDKLYISNSSISNPLIKGNFADSTLNVNGKMSISLTSQTPDSSLDVTGGVKLRTIYRSSALTDSMLLVGADGGVVKREVIVPTNTNVTRIISGSAVWDSLLIYSVTKCFYYINGILYNSLPTNVTLAAADLSNPRIDVIYCDTLGNVGVITGIPSPNPVKPTVNPLSQIELTHININAQGTTPTGVSNRIIYNENVGIPNEWNTSTDVPASGVDFAYMINPYVGVKSAFAPAYNSNYSLIFTNNAFVNADTLSQLSMYLRQNSAPPARVGSIIFSVVLFKSGVKITNPILVSDGFYGYSLLTLNSYQQLAIPFSSFVFSNPLDKTFDRIQIIIDVAVAPKLGFQFDYITIGAGGTPPAVTSDYWTLSGNDNTSFPNAKLGTTSNDQLSIVTDDIERINITNAGVISIPQLQTTTDTLLYKPLVINPSNGQVANIGNWGNNTVYTENPIMSRTSGDSNIIYFNADTANAWRGGGGATPTLQEVTTVGATTTDKVTMTGGYGLVTNEFNSLDGAGEKYSVINSFSESIGSIKLNWTDNFNTSFFNPSLEMVGEGSSSQNIIRIKTDEISLQNPDKGVLYMRMQNGTNEPFLYFPATNSVLGDTIATLADARALAGGGGTGTVTDISQGYGIVASPTNPITTSGTIDVDTTTSGLSGKYLRIVDTTDKWVNNISRTLGKDSIIFFIGSTRYAIKDSSGGQNLQQVTDKGATTSNNILIQSGALESIQYKNNSIEFRYTSIDPYITQTLYPTPYYLNQKDTLPSGSGVLALSVNGVKADSSGNITIGGVTTPTGYYGAFQDNTSQTAASINTAYPVKFNTTDLTNGVSIVNDGSSNPTRVTLANTGIYNIQFSLQLEKTGGSGNMIADIWIRKNGVDIPSTTGKVVLTGSANASPIVAAWNYVLDLAAGDYVQLMWATSNTNVEIVAAGATSPHPAIPSSILTVTQQSGIMAGTGITAINSLTGAAQTIVAGTSGTDFAVSSTGTTHTLNLPDASASNRGALTSANWTTFNNKIGAADTSVFQRKSISANTIMANNTASPANVTAQAFYDKPEQAYTGTITFTGTAPTTIINNTYQWSQVGKTVTLFVNLLYSGGNATTNIIFDLPSDCPTPSVPSGYSGASSVLYFGTYAVSNSLTTILRNGQSHLRRNSANTAYEITSPAWASIVSRNFQFQITYRAQ